MMRMPGLISTAAAASATDFASGVSHWMCLKWIESRVIHNEQQ
jgi:hypothetical protein